MTFKPRFPLAEGFSGTSCIQLEKDYIINLLQNQANNLNVFASVCSASSVSSSLSRLKKRTKGTVHDLKALITGDQAQGYPDRALAAGAAETVCRAK